MDLSSVITWPFPKASNLAVPDLPEAIAWMTVQFAMEFS